MKLIEPTVKLLPKPGDNEKEELTYYDMVKRVAKIARLCYRSELPETMDQNEIKDRDYELVHNLYTKKHTSVFEHVRLNIDACIMIPKIGDLCTLELFNDFSIKDENVVSEQGIIFREVQHVFCKMIASCINRTTVDKEDISLKKFEGPFFDVSIKDINLRELMDIFRKLTDYIGSEAAGRYFKKKHGSDIWFSHAFFLKDSVNRMCMKQHLREECNGLLITVVMAFWRALYTKLCGQRHSKRRKNVFDSIAKEQDFFVRSNFLNFDNAEEVFRKYAKKIINELKSKTIYNELLEESKKYIENGSFGKNEYIKITNAYRYYTFYIETNRGVLAELTRHRCLSPTVESTRYVNYSKTEKYGDICFTDEVSLAQTEDEPKKIRKQKEKKKRMLRKMYAKSEKMYNKLIKNGFVPQEARNILPNGLVSRMYVTGSKNEWNSFVKLRSDKSAHPDIRVISDAIKKYLKLPYDD